MVTPSRGCLQCRRLHVKCDESHPTCIRCIRRGIRCSGPITGALFFDETEKVKRKHPKRSEAPLQPTSAQECANIDNKQLRRSKGTIIVKGKRYELVQKAYTSQFRVPPHQPSRGEIFDLKFVSHLASSFGGWAIDPTFDFDPKWLSEICKRPDALPAIEFASRAVSMAFYAVLTGHSSIQKASLKWYSQALSCQRSCIEAGMNNDPGKISDTIYACLMMMYYEVVICTTPFGWADHAAAAVLLLEYIGPENCQEGKMNVVFRHLRLAAVYLAVHTKSPSPLAKHNWMTVPFALRPKLPLDELIDLMLCLPAYQAACDDLLTSSTPPPYTPDDIAALRAGLEQLLVGLDKWAASYGGDVAGTIIPLSDPDLGVKVHRSEVAACVLSLHHMATTIPHHLLLTLGPADPGRHHAAIVRTCAATLALARDELATGRADMGCVYLIFPVKVVGVCSLDEGQQRAARAILEGWASRKAISGIFVNSITWVESTAVYNMQMLDHTLREESLD